MTDGMQRLIVALAICGALAYLGWRVWRQAVAARQKPTGGCGPGCACDKH